MDTRSWLVRAALALGVGPGLSACVDAMGPSAVRSGRLQVSLAVAPASVSAGDSTVVRVVLRNMSDSEHVLSFGMGCPFYLAVYQRTNFSRPRAPLNGTGYPCVAAGFGLAIPPRDSAVYQHMVHSRIGHRAAPSGTYVLRASFTTSLPDLEASFRVR